MTWVHRAVLAGFGFGVGASIGSFLNVCIWRLPRGESLFHPPSRCPRCDARIAAYDNVPVLGWLWLRGRCRNCAGPISARYPLVEAATGALFALAAGAIDSLDGEPLLALARLLYLWSLISLLITTALMAYDRVNAPDRFVSSTGSALMLSSSRSRFALAATTATTLAAFSPLFSVDPLGAMLNLALLSVFFSDC